MSTENAQQPNSDPSAGSAKLPVSRRLEDVLVKVEGEIVSIRELPRHEYENFLETIHNTRLAYIAAVSRPNGG